MTNASFIFIDDDPINNLICRMMIEGVLGDVISQSFVSPFKALEYLEHTFLTEENSRQTIILLDVNMPGMSGWEFLDHFELFPPMLKNKVSIFVLSSSVDERDRLRSDANKNVVNFLVKPLSKETILTLMDKVTQHDRLASLG